MAAEKKFDQILGIIRYIMDDEEKLTKVLDFLEEKILDKEDTDDNFLENIPEKFHESIRQIAVNISANLVSYFNPHTLEVDYYPRGMLSQLDDEDEELQELEEKWADCTEIEPPESHESFRIMERFAEQLEDRKESSVLIDALSRSKPFARFNQCIHNSKYRDDWFAFRQKELERYVVNNYFYMFATS